jgi:hypothetical protein
MLRLGSRTQIASPKQQKQFQKYQPFSIAIFSVPSLASFYGANDINSILNVRKMQF